METIILAQMALNNKQLDTLNASKAKEVQANQKLNEQNQAERIKQIQASKEKVETAANTSWWSKLLDVVANAATFIASAAVLIAAVVAAPATGGLSLAVGALALYQLVSSGAELVNKAAEVITGERLFNFQLTVGAGIAAIAGAFGASDEVKQWIALGVDLVVNVAAMFIIPGAQLSAIGRIVKAVSTIVAGVAQVSKGSLDISRAFDVKALADIQAKLVELTGFMEAREFRKSSAALRQLWVLGNQYLTEAAPWTALKTDPERAGVAVRTGLNLVALFARVAEPFIPFTAKVIGDSVGIGVGPGLWPDPDRALDILTPGQTVKAPEVLFRKIEDTQVAEWRERFGGPEAIQG
jgi:hypothetical protein